MPPLPQPELRSARLRLREVRTDDAPALFAIHSDPQVMRYAVVVSYANGAGALLRTFSSNRQDAIEEINDMDADDFFEHVVKKHPAPQAPRYIWKLQKALDAM